MRFTTLLTLAVLIAGTALGLASRPHSESDGCDYRSDIQMMAALPNTLSATWNFATSLVTGGSGTSILKAPRTMWGE